MTTRDLAPGLAHQTGPTRRSTRSKLVDRAFSAGFKLPRATSSYSVAHDARVPMRDGCVLLADHYAPTGDPRGTLLVRSPYGRRSLTAILFARLYAERGFHVVIQSCRGSFGSGGVTDPLAGEVEDGLDTVAWLREQPWFTGTYATIGASYLGFTQWCVMTDPPPELAAAVILVGVHDVGEWLYGTGAFELESALGWSHSLAHQEEHGTVQTMLREIANRKKVRAAVDAVPLRAGASTLLGSDAPWYDEWIEHRDRFGAYWDARQARAALDAADVPVLLVAGWQDMFLEQDLHAYQVLRDRGVDVALTVGPWTHEESVTKGSSIVINETLDWLGAHLAGEKLRRTSDVRINVTGTKEWRDLDAWPPPSQERVLHLAEGGVLADAPSPGGEVTFIYDPSDPTPTVGGPLLVGSAGIKDNTAREERPDVVTFTGAVLHEDLETIGVAVVELAHTSDNPHADLFIRVSEVTPRGKSLTVADRFIRLDPDDTSGVLRLELRPMAHRFAAGSRIRLSIAGGSHPHYERNLGTGEHPATSTTMRPSTRRISLPASRIVLP